MRQQDSPFKILITDDLSPQGLARLEENPKVTFDLVKGLTPETLAQRIPGYDGLIVRSSVKVTEAVLAAADRLKVVGRAGVGVDQIYYFSKPNPKASGLWIMPSSCLDLIREITIPARNAPRMSSALTNSASTTKARRIVNAPRTFNCTVERDNSSTRRRTADRRV